MGEQGVRPETILLGLLTITADWRASYHQPQGSSSAATGNYCCHSKRIL